MKRVRARDKLCGLQGEYFGAFYKSSWRANDWMWGRIDGVGWLLQCLLDPQRLRVLRELGGESAFRDEVRTVFTEIGWMPPNSGDDLAAGEVAALNAQL